MHHNSIDYGRIVTAVMGMLEASCRDSFYEVLPRGVQVWLADEGIGVYPDLTVIAGQPLFHEGYRNRLINPCLLFEVLSESTPPYDPAAATMGDRGGLFSRCRAIPYLQEYIFIHQQEPRVEQLYRVEDQVWGLSVYEGLDAVVELNLTDTRMALLEIYDNVLFEALV